MATLNNIIGFETQNLIESNATGGSPSIDTTTFHGNGKAALSLASGDGYTFSAFEGGSSNGNNPFGIQFYYRTTDRTVAGFFFAALNDDGSNIFRLVSTGSSGVLRATDQSSVDYDSATGVLVNDTWHLIQVIWNQSDSGSIDVWVDGTSVISSATFDGNVDGGFNAYRFLGGGASTRRFDDVLVQSGLTSAAADFLDDFEVYLYKGDTGATVVAGSTTLDSGAWSDVWELVHNDTNYAYYTISGAKSGGIDFDGGSTWSGPSGDTNIDTISGAKWISRMRRENGGATNHFHRIGNDVDGWSNKAQTLGTAFVTYYTLTVDVTEVPTSTQYARGGFGHDGTGGREQRLGEIYVNILNEIPAAAGGFVPYPSPRGIKGGMNQVDGGMQ